MGKKPQRCSRRSVVSAAGSAMGLASIAKLGRASRGGKQNSFNPNNFSQLFDWIVEYREANQEERAELDDDLNSRERSVLEDVFKPAKVTTYQTFSTSMDAETLSGKVGLQTDNNEILIKMSENRFFSAENQWNWDLDTVVDIIREDDVEKLPLEHKYDEVNLEEVAKQSTVQSTSSGSEEHSYIQEDSSVSGFSTLWEWEHEINWDWEITDGGGRVSNTRNAAYPRFTNWFVSYSGVIDENTWIEEDGNPWNDDYNEVYVSYQQSKFYQEMPVVGIENYSAYPYSTLEGDGGGFGSTRTWESGIDK